MFTSCNNHVVFGIVLVTLHLSIISYKSLGLLQRVCEDTWERDGGVFDGVR